METTVFEIKEEDLSGAEKAALISKAGEVIRNGGLVAFPTETVYGLGGNALNPESSKKIYAAKGRPSDNPLIVHISKMESLSEIIGEFPFEAAILAEKFWPGPLTMIFRKSEKVPTETTGGLDTVAVRFPSHKVAQALIEASGGYIAAPSANLSGKPSPTLAKYVAEDLNGRVDIIIDGGDIPIGLESTIVDVTVEPPMILRPGYITEEMICEAIGEVDVDPTVFDGKFPDRPKAPGMKYRHYAPNGSLTVVEGNEEAVVRCINEELDRAAESGKKTGVIATTQNAEKYRADSVKIIGSRDNEEEIASKLYRILREFDDENVEVIYAESFPEKGLGSAIMNRLLKAAGHQKMSVWEDA